MDQILFWLVPAASIMALCFAWYFHRQIMKESEGTPQKIKIAAAVRRAGDVDLCVTPELALSGLNPGDYLSMNDFVEGCRRGLDILAETFKDGPDLLVGAPVISVYDPKLLSNAAVHIHGGTWEVVSRKIRHPASQDPEARFFDRGVSCGIMTLQGWRLGVVLCESDSSDEFWNVQGVGRTPLIDLISRGADAISYMTATPYTKDRAGEEYAILSHVAARHHVHLLCVNAVGGNDGLVYAGQSTAFDPTGALYARGKAFEEDVVVLDTALPAALWDSPAASIQPSFSPWALRLSERITSRPCSCLPRIPAGDPWTTPRSS